MTIRVLAYVECNECRALYHHVASVNGLLHDEIDSEMHDVVLAAEADRWQCRRNATEHICSHCLTPWD